MRTRGMPPFGLFSKKEKDRIYSLASGGFMFTSPYVLTPSTARNQVVILVAIDSPPFLIGQPEGMVKQRAVLVGSQVLRALAAVDVKLISINIVPADPLFHILGKAAKSRILALPPSVFARYGTDLEMLYAGKLPGEQARTLYTKITATVASYVGASCPANLQQTKISAILRAYPDISLEGLAVELGVCYETASRLFTDAVGIPLRSFNYAARIQACIKEIGKGVPLTQIAHDAGFADSAHLTRSWKQAFGMPPSYISKGAACEVTYC